MTAAPNWARGDAPSIEEEATEAMKQDVAATRQYIRGTGNLPLNHESARLELSEEQRHNRGTRPRTRKWKALDRLDEEIDKVTARHGEAIGRLTNAEAALTQAPDADARSLATWLSNGSKGSRPSASITERQRDLDAARLLVAAVAVELDRALERRLEHIEKNRARMLADARKDIDDAHQQLLRNVNELPALRQQLADGRETLLWVASYPDHPEAFGFATAAALGLRKPIETTLNTSARIEYANLVAALEADADAVASTFSSEQQRQLGETAERTPLREAMWDADPDNVKWKRAELERARAIGEYSPDLNRVADEARDFRP